MIRRLVPLLGLAALLSAPGMVGGQEPQEDSRPGIAVFRLDNGGSHGTDAEAENFEALEVGLQQMLMSELSVNTALRVVDRAQLRTLMAEQDLLGEGRVDPATAARIGRIVGARYAVLGGFVDLFGDFHLNARIVDTETTEVLASRQVRDRREQIYDLLVDLSAQIAESVDLPPLPAQEREARKDRQIPPEAITLYSRAQVFEDLGQPEQAITLYRRITEEFPQMVEAQQALTQLSG